MPIFKGKCTNLAAGLACDNALDDVELEVEAPSSQMAACPQCGQPLEITEGVVKGPETDGRKPERDPKPPRRRGWVVPAGIAAALIGLVGAGAWAMSGDDADETFPQQAVAPVAPPAVGDPNAPPPIFGDTALSPPAPITEEAEPAVVSTPAETPEAPRASEVSPPVPPRSRPAPPVVRQQPERVYYTQPAPVAQAAPPPARPAEPAPAVPAATAPTPSAPAVAPATPAAVLARNAVIQVRPARNYCASDLKRGAAMQFALIDEVPLSGGVTLPAGTQVIGRVTNREVGASAGDPDRLRVELTSLTHDGNNIGVSTGALPLEMRRGSAVGTVLKYSAVGAAAGATVAVLLKKNVAAGAGIGAGAGAAAGAAQAAMADPCLVAEDTFLPFRITRDATIQ